MKWIHEQISEAIANGELTQPESMEGKKLDLDAYFATPQHLRVGYSVLAGAGFTPFEVDHLRQMNDLETAISAEDNEERLRELKTRFNALSAQMNLKQRLF